MKCAFTFIHFYIKTPSSRYPFGVGDIAATYDPRFQYFVVGDCSCAAGVPAPSCDASASDVGLVNQIASTQYLKSRDWDPEIRGIVAPNPVCGSWTAWARFWPGEVTCDCSALYEWGIGSRTGPEDPLFVLFNHGCIDPPFANPEAGFTVFVTVEASE